MTNKNVPKAAMSQFIIGKSSLKDVLRIDKELGLTEFSKTTKKV